MSIKDFFRAWDGFFTDIESIYIEVANNVDKNIAFNMNDWYDIIFKNPNHFEYYIVKYFSIRNNQIFFECIDIY